MRQTKEQSLTVLKTTATVVSRTIFINSLCILFSKQKCKAWNRSKWIHSIWSLPTFLLLVQHLSNMPSSWPLKILTAIYLSNCFSQLLQPLLAITPLLFSSYTVELLLSVFQCVWASQVLFLFHLSSSLHVLGFTPFSFLSTPLIKSSSTLVLFVGISESVPNRSLHLTHMFLDMLFLIKLAWKYVLNTAFIAWTTNSQNLLVVLLS